MLKEGYPGSHVERDIQQLGHPAPRTHLNVARCKTNHFRVKSDDLRLLRSRTRRLTVGDVPVHHFDALGLAGGA